MKQLQKISAWIYQRVFPRIPGLKTQSVRQALIRTGKGSKKQEDAFYIRKLSLVLAVLIAGTVLIILLKAADFKEDGAPDDVVTRAPYGGTQEHLSLTAADENGEVLGTYDVAVLARQYTEEECARFFEEASAKLPEVILGDNAALTQVRTPLRLVTGLDGYPFRITWSSSDYFRLRTDGTPDTSDVSEEGEEVILTAAWTYGPFTFSQDITVRVVPPEETDGERLKEAVGEALKSREEETRHEEAVPLPTDVMGRRITWERVKSDATPLLALLVLAAAVLVYFAQDQSLQQEVKKRDDTLMKEYPGFVSRLALYLGAGLPVRSIFLKLAADYEEKKKKGGEVSPLMEEVRTASFELKNGVSEGVVYERFAARIGLTPYTKLCALLTQNMVKGSAQLLSLMRAESAQAVRERMDRARVLGEQAATRLMLPMMLMLGVVMVLIMVPAYLSF